MARFAGFDRNNSDRWRRNSRSDTAYFNGNLNTPGAITLKTAAGQNFVSHPAGLYYRDIASGKLALIAPVQDTAGVLVPPNMVVHSNALAGLNASFTYVYAHNGFDQSLVFSEAPPAPDVLAGLNPATTRLELWTVLDSWPDPQEERPVVLKTGANPQADLVDHVLIFADCMFPVGAAFTFGEADLPATGQPARVAVVDPSDKTKVLVAKSLVQIGNLKVLVESVDYEDLFPKFQALPQRRAEKGTSGSSAGSELKLASLSLRQ